MTWFASLAVFVGSYSVHLAHPVRWSWGDTRDAILGGSYARAYLAARGQLRE